MGKWSKMRKSFFVLFLSATLSNPVLFSNGGEEHQGVVPESPLTEELSPEREIIQKICPVMVGNDIDPDIYSVYKGKRVYFCCQMCKDAFEKNPEQYLDGLPQFVPTNIPEHEAPPPARLSLFLGRLVKPAGIATFALLLLTFLCGYFMPKKRTLLFKWHRRLAYTTIIVAILHAALVLFFS